MLGSVGRYLLTDVSVTL